MRNNNAVISGYVARDIEPQIHKFIDDSEAIIIRGPRQSGKTSLLNQIEYTLRKRKLEVVYRTFEDEVEKIRFEANPKEYVEFYIQDSGKRTFLLLDEVQYIKDAGKIIKMVYDLYPQVKLVLTGSSTLDLTDMGKYLVGRAVFFELYPFSFGEYLRAKDERLLKVYFEHKFDVDNPGVASTVFLSELNYHLKDYVTYGGYPRIVIEKSIDKKVTLLRNLYNTYVEKDVIKIYGLKYKDDIYKILRYIANNTGSMFNYSDAASSLNLKYEDIQNLLGILEETYVVKRIRPFHRNLSTELKKSPKVYFYDLGMRNTILELFSFDEKQLGDLYENYVFNVFRAYKINYWRTQAKAEVDFVLRDNVLPIEVKLKARTSRSLYSFLDTYKPAYGVVTSPDESGKIKKAGVDIYKVPLALL